MTSNEPVAVPLAPPPAVIDDFDNGYDDNDEGFDASQALQDFRDFGSPSDYINF